jgi:hypothetical protein
MSLEPLSPCGRQWSWSSGGAGKTVGSVSSSGEVKRPAESLSNEEGSLYRKYIVKEDGNNQGIITYTSFGNGNLIDR